MKTRKSKRLAQIEVSYSSNMDSDSIQIINDIRMNGSQAVILSSFEDERLFDSKRNIDEETYGNEVEFGQL